MMHVHLANEGAKSALGGKTEDKSISAFLSKELDTNTCPICYELMMPPEHAPMLLFPCGHTFCKACLNMHMKVNKKQCPSCRGRVQSQCVNFSLQNMIQSLAAKERELSMPASERKVDEHAKTLEEALIGPNASDVQKYFQEYRMYSLRVSVLANHMRDMKQLLSETQDNVNTTRTVVQHLEDEESGLVNRIDRLQRELKLVQRQLHERRDEHDRLASHREAILLKIKTTESCTETLQTELDKCKLILSALAPKFVLDEAGPG